MYCVMLNEGDGYYEIARFDSHEEARQYIFFVVGMKARCTVIRSDDEAVFI